MCELNEKLPQESGLWKVAGSYRLSRLSAGFRDAHWDSALKRATSASFQIPVSSPCCLSLFCRDDVGISNVK
jgi:hypothetical protein